MIRAAVVLSFFWCMLNPALAVDGEGPVGLDGHPVDPFADADRKAVVLIFMAEDCPISNRYVPLLNELASRYSGLGVAMWSVYPNPGVTTGTLRKHREEFKIAMPAIIDAGQSLVARCGATVTPEVFVFVPVNEGDRAVEMIYKGRIDDQYFDFGKWRPQASTSDLEDAIEAVLSAGPLEFKETRAVGCYIVTES